MDNNELNQIPAENAGTSQPEKKKSFFSPVKLAVVAVVAIVLIAIAANGKAFANTIKKTFSSPEKYYRSVEANALMQSTEVATATYERLLEMLNLKDFRQSVTFSAELGEKLNRVIKKNTDVDVSGLGSVSISMDALMKKDVLGFGAGLSLGKKSVISLDALLDMKNQKAYLQIPELNKKYLGTENEDQDDAEEFREEYEKLKTALDGFPKKKQLDKLMEKYIELALSQIKEVKKTTEKIEADGVTQKCTALVVEVDEDTLADIFEAVAEELDKDKDLRKLVVDACNAMDLDGEDIYDDFIEELVEGLEDMAEEVAESRLDATMIVYVDSKGAVRGRNFEIKVTNEFYGWNDEKYTSTNVAEFEFLTAVDGSKVGLSTSLKIKEDDDEKRVVFKAEGSGKQSMGKLTGDFTIKVMGLSVADVSIRKLDLSELKKGFLNGTVAVSASETIAKQLENGLPSELEEILSEANINPGKVALEFDFENSEKMSKVSVRAIYKEEMLFQLSAARESKADAETKLPSEKNVVFAEEPEDVLDWLEECDWDGFVKNLKKTTLPEELIEMIEEAIDELEDIDSAGEIPFVGKALRATDTETSRAIKSSVQVALADWQSNGGCFPGAGKDYTAVIEGNYIEGEVDAGWHGLSSYIAEIVGDDWPTGKACSRFFITIDGESGKVTVTTD